MQGPSCVFWACFGLQYISPIALVGAFSLSAYGWKIESGPLVTTVHASNVDNSYDAKFSFRDEHIRSLDLTPVVRKVAAYTGTKRAYQALLALVSHKTSAARPNFGSQYPSKRRSVVESYFRSSNFRRNVFRAEIAQTASQAVVAYDLVAQADLALQKIHNLTFPPLYGADSGPFDNGNIPESDDDEWLDTPIPEWRLDFVLQAEQVLLMLLKVEDWSRTESAQMWTPLLVDIARRIDRDVLRNLYKEVQGSVKVLSVRTINDPNARSTFSFRLSDSKFPVLALLRKRQMEIEERLKDGVQEDKKLVELKEEILAKENDIAEGLALVIQRQAATIDDGLNCVAELDVVFAKAAFGIENKGRIPTVRKDGIINVSHFLHPLLLNPKSNEHSPLTVNDAVPIDLRLSSKKGQRVVIISGPNGGGKTLAMKSFGLVCSLCKIGIPVPTNSKERPHVNFFDDIFTSIGDQQNVEKGQSTFMAQLSTYSKLITAVQRVDTAAISTPNTLILMDELGMGTEANAGGAIAQAIIEKLLESPSCHIVATTHSARLKTLSFESGEFECATVLLETNSLGDASFQKPSYQLQYGVIGESNALGAASRAVPPLPEDVLIRASDLMVTATDASTVPVGGENSDEISGAYIQALTASLEKQVQMAHDDATRAAQLANDNRRIQRAMRSMAASYDRHLEQLLDQVQQSYQKLKSQKSMVEVVGETLAELRVVQKKIRTEQDILRDRGLKIISALHQFTEGEAVMILSDNEWNNMNAKVVLLDAHQRRLREMGPDDVAVLPEFSWDSASELFSIDNETPVAKPIIISRYQLALWDYDSVWEDTDEYEPRKAAVSGIHGSKRRLHDLLSSIETDSSTTGTRPHPSTARQRITNNSFTSSRQRKAVQQKVKRKKK
jgi:hypothetical protein